MSELRHTMRNNVVPCIRTQAQFVGRFRRLLGRALKIAIAESPAGVCFAPEGWHIADSLARSALCQRQHEPGQDRRYSITSSARVRNDSEMVNPSVFAVLRFTISSNLVGN
jgi:hypothetical protein